MDYKYDDLVDEVESLSNIGFVKWYVDNHGGGGTVTKTYVDNQDAATLASAESYSDTSLEIHRDASDAKYQAKLTAGTNITITPDNVISASGGGGGGIPEAPQDGKTYGRKDGAWVEVTGSSGPVVRAPEIFTWHTGDSTTFTLAMAPAFFLDVMVLEGDTKFYYLQSELNDYTSTGSTITINSPTLTDGMRVKVIYAA